MSAHSTRRFAFLLLIIVPLLSFQCATTDRSHKHEKRYKPVITVDDKTLTASPRVTLVWDVEPANPDADCCHFQRSNKPVTITWTTKDPAFQLDVAFVEPCPIPKPDCKTPGQCTVRVPPFTTEAPEPYRCTYKMFDRSNPAKEDQDEDIVVIPCCM